MRWAWAALLAGAVGCGGKLLYLPLAGGEAEWSQRGGGPTGQGRSLRAPDPPLRLLWQQSLRAAPVGGPLVEGGLILQLSAGPSLLAFDRQVGRPVGRRGLSAPPSAAPVLAGSLRVGGEAGPKPALRAYERREHRVVWIYPGLALAPLAGRGDTVVVAMNAGEVVALAAATGQRLWRARMEGPLWTGPVLAGDATYTEDGKGGLTALDLGSGSRRWTLDLGGPLRGLAADDSLIYVATAAGSVLACKGTTGAVVWRRELGVLPAPGLALAGGVLVLGAADRSVRGLDLADGALRWQFTAQGVIGSPPVASGGAVYAAGSEGYLYALDPESGRLQWKYQLDGPALQPLALGEGVVGAVTEERTLYVFGR